MADLADFQDAFLQALAGDPLALGRLDVPNADLAVYRNTIARGLIESLVATFPTVQRLVGDAWFEAAAGAFARLDPPRSPVLLEYGGGFADFLASFPPAADLPYLPAMASLDWLWLEAHTAADAPTWSAADATSIPPLALFDLTLDLHPATRLAWFDDMNAPSLWILNRPPAPEPDGIDLVRGPEGLLLTRPYGAVEHRILGPGAHALIGVCQAGRTLGLATEAALEAEPGLDLPATLLAMVEAGAFTGPTRA